LYWQRYLWIDSSLEIIYFCLLICLFIYLFVYLQVIKVLEIGLA